MKSPTPRLVAGLVFTLLVISAYAAYTLYSVNRMRQVQTGTIERNRRASLQLIRIQNDLNALALAMRDMVDNSEQYPLQAWRAPLARMRLNLEDAIAKEAALAPSRAVERTAFVQASFADFWRAMDGLLARSLSASEVSGELRVSLLPRQEALSALIASLLVEMNEEQSRAGQQVATIYSEIESNAYRFLAISIVLVVLMSVSVIRVNRRLFLQLSSLADQRRELARQLIANQESTFRSISRDLHDEFGQILTALGAMLRRAKRLAPDTDFQGQIEEATLAVQVTLDKVRSLSQSLHPVILEEQGLLAAIEWHIPVFERQTQIKVDYQPPSVRLEIPTELGIHIFRILQESLSNVARHAQVETVQVAWTVSSSGFELSICDRGVATHPLRPGIGLTAMRERAGLIGGQLRIGPYKESGTHVSLLMQLPHKMEAPLV